METLLYIVLGAASAGFVTATVLMYKMLTSKRQK